MMAKLCPKLPGSSLTLSVTWTNPASCHALVLFSKGETLLEMYKWKVWSVPCSLPMQRHGWGQGPLPQEADSCAPSPLHPSHNSRNCKPQSSLLSFPGSPFSLPCSRSEPQPLSRNLTCSLARLLSSSLHHLSDVTARLLSSLQGEQVILSSLEAADLGFAYIPIMVALALLGSWVHCRTPTTAKMRLPMQRQHHGWAEGGGSGFSKVHFSSCMLVSSVHARALKTTLVFTP